MKKITILCTALLLAATVSLSAQSPGFSNVYQMNIMVGFNNTFTFAIKSVPVKDLMRTKSLISWMDSTIEEHKVRIYTVHILEKNDDIVRQFKTRASITDESFVDLEAGTGNIASTPHTAVPGIYPFGISLSELGTGFTVSSPSDDFNWKTMDSFSNVNFGKATVAKKQFDVKQYSFYIAAWSQEDATNLRKMLTGE